MISVVFRTQHLSESIFHTVCELPIYRMFNASTLTIESSNLSNRSIYRMVFLLVLAVSVRISPCLRTDADNHYRYFLLCRISTTGTVFLPSGYFGMYSFLFTYRNLQIKVRNSVSLGLLNKGVFLPVLGDSGRGFHPTYASQDFRYSGISSKTDDYPSWALCFGTYHFLLTY